MASNVFTRGLRMSGRIFAAHAGGGDWRASLGRALESDAEALLALRERASEVDARLVPGERTPRAALVKRSPARGGPAGGGG